MSEIIENLRYYPLKPLELYTTVGLANYLKTIYSYVNPDLSCYNTLNDADTETMVIYSFNFKIRTGNISEEEYNSYVDNIIIFNSKYVTLNYAIDWFKEKILNFRTGTDIFELGESINLEKATIKYNYYKNLYKHSSHSDLLYTYYLNMYNLWKACYEYFEGNN